SRNRHSLLSLAGKRRRSLASGEASFAPIHGCDNYDGSMPVKLLKPFAQSAVHSGTLHRHIQKTCRNSRPRLTYWILIAGQMLLFWRNVSKLKNPSGGFLLQSARRFRQRRRPSASARWLSFGAAKW